MQSSSKSPAPRAAAFFDLDKTLMAGSSAMPFARAARQRGLVGRRQLARWGVDHLRYRLRGASDEETGQVIDAAREMLADVPVKEIERMVPELMAGILPLVYPQMLDEVHEHQDAGRPTVIVSAAGSGIVESVAQALGMDGGIGTKYAIGPGGNFTGELDGPFVYGLGKVTAIKQFAAASDIDLASSYAYSDSVSDLPMLRAVGNAVVVNPDSALMAVAKVEGWRVLRFEKLGRRLAIIGATALAAAVGGGAGVATRRHQSGRKRRPLAR
ncbi:MAG: HAD family hydrolase [Solirubrobacterales bacterium]